MTPALKISTVATIDGLTIDALVTLDVDLTYAEAVEIVRVRDRDGDEIYPPLWAGRIYEALWDAGWRKAEADGLICGGCGEQLCDCPPCERCGARVGFDRAHAVEPRWRCRACGEISSVEVAA